MPQPSYFVRYARHPKDKDKPLNERRIVGCVVAGKLDGKLYVGWSKRDRADAVNNAFDANAGEYVERFRSYEKKRGREIAVNRLVSKTWEPVFDIDTGAFAHAEHVGREDKIIPYLLRDDLAAIVTRARKYFFKNEQEAGHVTT